jgi:methylated-DNA-[protein]-cysteine S-methyltransferase
MVTVYSKTPLGIAKICGDDKGISVILSFRLRIHSFNNSNLSLTGYAGGLWRKKGLLEHENLTTKQSLF